MADASFVDNMVDRIMVQALEHALSKLKPQDAAILRALHEELADFSELDEFVLSHCAPFEAYEPAGEQNLEWTELHVRYVALVESKIAAYLESLGASSDDLHRLLQEVVGDPQADEFLARLLSYDDYFIFCEHMRLYAQARASPNASPHALLDALMPAGRRFRHRPGHHVCSRPPQRPLPFLHLLHTVCAYPRRRS